MNDTDLQPKASYIEVKDVDWMLLQNIVINEKKNPVHCEFL